MAANPATELKLHIKTTGTAGLTKLASSLRGINGIAKQSKINFTEIGSKLKETNATMVRSTNNVKRLKEAFEEQARSVDRTTKEFKEATEAAKKLDKELAKMEKRRPAGGGMRGAAQIAGTVAGAGVFGGFEGAAGALIGAPFGPGGAIVGGAIGAQVGQLRQALGATAEYAANLQKLKIALVGVTTSNAEYATALDAITQATQDYALPQDVVTRQFTKLQASVQGAGGNIDDTKAAFDGIVSAVRATGGSLNDVDAALTATAQVFSKGKVSAEELRQQIGERLPGAFTLFAESMGKTPQELDKALEKGQVSLQDFMVFVRKITERYKENAKAIADSPAAAGDRLKRDLAELSESVGRLLAPIGAGFQEIFGQITRVILGATQALNRFLGLAFDEQKYQSALMTIADYEALKMTGGLPKDRRSQKAANQRYFQALETVKRQTALMQGTGAGAVRPEEGTGLPGIDLDGIGGAGRASARQDISFALRQARIAVIQEENAERKLALQFEEKLLEIAESQYLENERAVKLQQALKDLSDGRAKIEEKRARDKAKRDRELKAFYDSFKIETGEFNMNAKGEGAKTPFDMLRQGADEFTDSLKGSLEAAKELATVGLQGISDGITELVVNGTLNFREFAASLLRDMARIIMQQIVMKSLMQAIGFGGGGIDPSSFSLSNPTQFNTSAVKIGSQGFGMTPLMAKGGITQGLSIAGEAGPEAVVPLPDGRSIPVTMQGGAGNVVVNVDAKGTSVQGDSTRSNALGDAIGSAVRQELLRQRRPGGLLA